MKMNIGNQKLQKKFNRELILNLMCQHGHLSRSQIAEKTGLGWGSITKYTAEMLRENLIKEVGEQKSKGRSSVILGLNKDFKYILGLDIGSSYIKGIVVNMGREECAFLREATLWNADRKTVLEQLFSFIEKLLEQAGITADRLLAIGCGFAGGIDFESGTVKRAGNFSDFDQVPLAGILNERFKTPCFVANGITVRLLGESISEQVKDNDNVAYISLGTGVGAGIILHSKILVPTEDERIGDIAHYMVEKKGPRCYCGLHGCLEALVGARHLLDRVQKLLPESDSSLKNISSPLSWEIIAENANIDDPLVSCVLSEAGHYIGMALCGIIQFHRPGLIILGGGMTNLGDRLIQPIKDEVSSFLPIERFDVDNIVISEQACRCGAAGATLYAWDNIFYSQHEYINLNLNKVPIKDSFK